MNFLSEGKDKGSTFSFDFPLYASKSNGIELANPAAAVESDTMEVTYIDPTNYGDLEAGTNTWRAIQTSSSSLLQRQSNAHLNLTPEPTLMLTPRSYQENAGERVETIDESPQQEHKATTPRGSMSSFHLCVNITVLTANIFHFGGVQNRANTPKFIRHLILLAEMS